MILTIFSVKETLKHKVFHNKSQITITCRVIFKANTLILIEQIINNLLISLEMQLRISPAMINITMIAGMLGTSNRTMVQMKTNHFHNSSIVQITFLRLTIIRNLTFLAQMISL